MRANGGVWIHSSDIPHAFQHLIVYHNLSTFKKTEVYSDIWQVQDQPYIANEKDIYIKMTVDEELFSQYKSEHKIAATQTYDKVFGVQTDQQISKESWSEDGLLPGERKKPAPSAQ